jgi:hypothetical protein
MPYIVKFDPLSINKQADVISDATPTSDGVMTSAMVQRLNTVPDGGSTYASVYARGTNSSDQTATIDPAKGGPMVDKATAVGVGPIRQALTSSLGVLLDITDNATQVIRSFMTDGPTAVAHEVGSGISWADPSAIIQRWKNGATEIAKLLATGDFFSAGMVFENLPSFGSPMIRGQAANGFISVTSDGVGGSFGGTGVTVKQDAISPELSVVALTVNDLNEAGLFPEGFYIMRAILGAQAPTLTIIANAVAPTERVSFIGDGLLKNIIPNGPFGRSQEVKVIPTGAGLTWDSTGNIANPGAGVQNQPITCIFIENTGKWYLV